MQGEDICTAAIREVKEETGVSKSITEYCCLTIDYFSKSKAMPFILFSDRNWVCWGFSIQVRVRQIFGVFVKISITTLHKNQLIIATYVISQQCVLQIQSCAWLQWSLFFLVSGKAINLSSKSHSCSLSACCNLVPLTFRGRFQKLRQLRYVLKSI